MEVKIIKSEPKELKIEFSEVDQGLLNAIKDALWNNSNTDMAGFNIPHPEVGKPVFFLRTTKESAKDVWNKAIAELDSEAADLAKLVKNL